MMFFVIRIMFTKLRFSIGWLFWRCQDVHAKHCKRVPGWVSSGDLTITQSGVSLPLIIIDLQGNPMLFPCYCPTWVSMIRGFQIFHVTLKSIFLGLWETCDTNSPFHIRLKLGLRSKDSFSKIPCTNQIISKSKLITEFHQILIK